MELVLLAGGILLLANLMKGAKHVAAPPLKKPPQRLTPTAAARLAAAGDVATPPAPHPTVTSTAVVRRPFNPPNPATLPDSPANAATGGDNPAPPPVSHDPTSENPGDTLAGAPPPPVPTEPGVSHSPVRMGEGAMGSSDGTKQTGGYGGPQPKALPGNGPAYGTPKPLIRNGKPVLPPAQGGGHLPSTPGSNIARSHPTGFAKISDL